MVCSGLASNFCSKELARPESRTSAYAMVASELPQIRFGVSKINPLCGLI